MKANQLAVCFIALILFVTGSVLLFTFLEHQSPISIQSQQTVYLAGDAVQQPASKIKLVSYEHDSDAPIGVLINVDADKMDSVSKLLKSKGASVSKHKVGHVIAASIPENQIDAIAAEQDVLQILPNRPVQAFSVDETAQTNVQTLWDQDITGKNVIVAVLDSGINTGRVITSKDFSGSGTTKDESGHGTAIANVIVAMAPNVKLINAKVLDKDNAGSEASVVAGINYAVEQGADVISLSLGGFFNDLNSPLVTAVEEATKKGVTVVVASGNCGKGCTKCSGFIGVATPGNAPDVITVGAINGEEPVCYSSGDSFSNYIKPDVVAPVSVAGSSVSGTSIATPFVSGAAALLIEKYHAKPLEIKSLLELNAKDLGSAGKDTVFGSGKLNLDFITETPQETEIHYETEKPKKASKNTIVKGFGADNPTTSAGNWYRFDPGLWSEVYQPYYWDLEESVEMYNSSFGFIFGMYSMHTFNGSKNIDDDWSTTGIHRYNNTGNPITGYFTDIKILNSTVAYGSRLNRIMKWDGTTNMWGEVLHSDGLDLEAIDFSGSVGFAGGINSSNGQGIIYKFTGSAWNPESMIFAPIKDIRFVNQTLALAIGSSVNNGVISQSFYKWNGIAWTLDANMNSTSRGELNEMEIVTNTLAYAVGYNGTIMKWDGNVWTSDSSPTGNNLYSVSFADPTLGYAVGSNATILKFNNGTWNLHSEGEAFFSMGFCDYKDGLINNSCLPLIIENVTFNNVKVLSPTTGFLFGKGTYFGQYGGSEIISFMLQPTAPFLNVPALTVEQNMTLSIDLHDYSDGDSFVINSGNCGINNNTLVVQPALNFIGLMSCQITATKNSLSTTRQVPIEVTPGGPTADLVVTPSDIIVVNTNDPEKVNITIKNVGKMNASNVDVKIIETYNNKKQQEKTFIIPSIESKSAVTTTVTNFDIKRGSVITVIADYTNNIAEFSEGNNRAETVYKNLDAYLNFTIQPQFIGVVTEYLQKTLGSYNIVASPANARVVINIGYDLGNTQIGCKKGTVYLGGKAVDDVHTGVIYTEQSNGVSNVNICGARIEGLVNAIKRLNKEDVAKDREVFFDRNDLGAIAVLDYFAGKILNENLVKQALGGGLSVNEEFVQTTDGTLLRLRHYKPQLSQAFLDFLLHLDINKPWLSPVIMAGGLWSDITAWDEAGKEIASGIEDGYTSDAIKYSPRDVWLIELTGGPNTECDSCADYTYEDVVDKHWPALVGGVIKLTNKWPVAYVGHSNGGRVALDALKNWSVSGKASAGKLADGTPFSLPANPIDNYIGVGVPGAFNGNSNLKSLILAKGDIINQKLSSMNHISYLDLITVGNFLTNKVSTDKISLNTWKKYFNFMNSTADTQPGIGVSLKQSLFIAGTLFGTNDEIVPVSDVDSIYSNINVTTGFGNKKILVHVWDGHLGMTETTTIKRTIKQFLNNDPLTENIENQVNG